MEAPCLSGFSTKPALCDPFTASTLIPILSSTMCWKCPPGHPRSHNWHQVDALYEEERWRDALNEGPAAALLFVKVFKYFLAAAVIGAVAAHYAPEIYDNVVYETVHGERPPVVQKERVP